MDELRRQYHDRIADVRQRACALVHLAAEGVERVTVALLDGDTAGGLVIVEELADVAGQVAGIEEEVLDLLALQAPVARDLRMVVSSLFIAQIADLCVGLVRTLGARVDPRGDLLSSDMRGLAEQTGEEAAALLRRAAGAWSALDPDGANSVIEGAAHCRELQQAFFVGLLSLHDLPIEVAIDLGMVARAYERLSDHAVEIAGRVIFAATGDLPDAAGLVGG